MAVINLILGDPSGDGHGQTCEYLIETESSVQEIQDAYDTGTKMVGFDLTAEVCSEYEDHEFPIEYFQTLKNFGFNKFEYPDWMWYQEFVDIWLFIVQLGNPNLNIRLMNKQDIFIGGYGFGT